MIRSVFTACGAILLLTAELNGEVIDQITRRFEIIGPSSRPFCVDLDAEPSIGIRIRVSPGGWSPESIKTMVRSIGFPTIGYHSPAFGQFAILPFSIGGGTGVSFSMYCVIYVSASGPRVLRQALANYAEVSHGLERSLMLDSDFRPIENGFTQTVRITQVTSLEEQTNRPRLLKAVRLHYHLIPSHEGELQLQCEMDGRIARALTDILNIGMSRIEEWAADILVEAMPEVADSAKEYLQLPDEARENGVKRILSIIDKRFPGFDR